MVALDARSGETLWEYRYDHSPHEKHLLQFGEGPNSTPLIAGELLFTIGVARDGDAVRPEEIWTTRRVQFFDVSSAQVGDWVYGSTGTSIAFMTAINVRTGEVAWRERGIGKANCVAADGKLVILDEDGKLYLASATPEKLVVHAEVSLLERVAWTVPTIVGTTLYVRDRKEILALDLG